MAKTFLITRDITVQEAPWLDLAILAGEILYEYRGATYGVLGSGIALTRLPDTHPFMEIPRDAVTCISDKT